VPVDSHRLWERFRSLANQRDLISELAAPRADYAKQLAQVAEERWKPHDTMERIRSAFARFHRRRHLGIFAIPVEEGPWLQVLDEESLRDAARRADELCGYATVVGADVGYRNLTEHYHPGLFLLNAAYFAYDYREGRWEEDMDPEVVVGSAFYRRLEPPTVFKDRLGSLYDQFVESVLGAEGQLVDTLDSPAGRDQFTVLSELLAALAGSMSVSKDSGPVYGFFDRPLVPLHIQRFVRIPSAVRNALRDSFERGFRFCYAQGVLPVGVTYAATHALVNTLAVLLCSRDDCSGCALASERVNAPAASPDEWGRNKCPVRWFGERLKDLSVVDQMLLPGVRTAAFYIYSGLYTDRQPPYLTFYLKPTSDSVLRVEVLRTESTLNKIQEIARTVLAEATVGRGYPRVLERADRLSRITTTDRNLALALFNRFLQEFVDPFLEVRSTRKEAAKWFGEEV